MTFRTLVALDPTASVRIITLAQSDGKGPHLSECAKEWAAWVRIHTASAVLTVAAKLVSWEL